MRLANKVRETRRQRDITQAELAARAGVSRQTIVSIEGGDYVPSALLAAVLSRELDATFEELFQIEEDGER